MITSIHNRIAHVTEYFIDKLERGMYEVLEVDYHTAKIIIDKEFTFTIWICGGWESCSQHISAVTPYPIWLSEFPDTLKMDLHANLHGIKEERKKEEVRKKMDALKKELEYLERQAA